MGIRESYANGVFCWVDLATSDAEAAKPFYQQLLNWDFQDISVEGGSFYSMALKNDRAVAALYTMSDEMQQQQIPPCWQSYINVIDLDETIQQWQRAGGIILNPRFQPIGKSTSMFPTLTTL